MKFLRLLHLAQIAIWLACSCMAQPSIAQEIKVVTEELPPFSMTQSGRVTGLSTEVVRAVLKEAGLNASIQSVPWARAYDLAANTPNVLIYSISRTSEREKLFKWVGVIAPTHWYLFAMANRPLHIQKLSDARNFQIGTINEDVGEQYLKANGFTVGKNIQSSNEHKLIYEKLKLGRIDFWISDEISAFYLVRSAGEDPAKTLTRSLPLPELDGSEEGMEMAFGAKTPDETVQRFRRAFAEIQLQGIYAQILKNWH